MRKLPALSFCELTIRSSRGANRARLKKFSTDSSLQVLQSRFVNVTEGALSNQETIDKWRALTRLTPCQRTYECAHDQVNVFSCYAVRFDRTSNCGFPYWPLT